MKYKLDITGKKFYSMDLYEAEIFLTVPPKLPQTLTFEAWGVTLLTAPYWNERMKCDLPPDLNMPTKDDDIYISGFSTVVIEDVYGGQLEVTIYQSEPPHDFIKLQSGELVRLRRNWEYKKSSDLYLYEMYCVLDWPFGYCHFDIAAKGKATLFFHPEDCIPARKYVLNPARYGFNRENQNQ